VAAFFAVFADVLANFLAAFFEVDFFRPEITNKCSSASQFRK
jgi:hypothetical protein